MNAERPRRDEDGLNAARGTIVGVAVSIVLWAVIASIGLLWRRGWPL